MLNSTPHSLGTVLVTGPTPADLIENIIEHVKAGYSFDGPSSSTNCSSGFSFCLMNLPTSDKEKTQ